ncbi:potassium/proton antiporter [Pseudazoarcus pumilus]|uniref:Potassium/proton antiporter n=1 Tax=Pseudazoarcus pumilus TaxID=2067960 RepID=A0A2I6S5W2_9RHOO|nr:potassium/proton antiporter [Pseudazoarcus pumilus]AUN94631.1 potassium/proton antiporter [Pseudazoarcus pumilus]
MASINALLLALAFLLFVSVLASTLSARLGLPLLLLFLVVGMLAGEEGPGGIRFDDLETAMLIGQLALAVILLDGGLRTRVSTFRVAFAPAAILATWGVVATVLLLGGFAIWLFEVDWRVGLLLAAIVGSTDAAAVFSLLRNSGVRLNDRVKATLEIESGANDPMAILLVTVMIQTLMAPGDTDVWSVLRMLLQQFALGLIAGTLGGWVLTRLLSRLRLAEGLYALLIMSGGLMIFAATNALGGSGFLAIYLAGLVVGNRRSHATEHVLRVMDGLAWLAQAGMFLTLGLLVAPSQLVEHAPLSLAMAGFLMFVARPLAVMSCLFMFRFSLRELVYISWVGLRGAVPIVLAIYPLIMDVPNSSLLFVVAFAVVLVSLLVQGATVPVAARALGVVVPPRDEPVDRIEVWVDDHATLDLMEYHVGRRSRAEGMHPDELTRTEAIVGVRCAAVLRNGRLVPLDDTVTLEEGDAVWLIAPDGMAEPLAAAFAAGRDDELSINAGFFGEFTVDPDCPAGDLAAAYGLQLRPDEETLTIRMLIRQRLGRHAVEGDRVRINAFELTVRHTDSHGEIDQVGLKCPRVL